jgi:hypothetical protein
MSYWERLRFAYRAAPFNTLLWAFLICMAIIISRFLIVPTMDGSLLNALIPLLSLLVAPLISVKAQSKVSAPRSIMKMRYAEKVWIAYRNAPFTALTWAFYIYIFISAALYLVAPHFSRYVETDLSQTGEDQLGMALAALTVIFSLLVAPLPTLEIEA